MPRNPNDLVAALSEALRHRRVASMSTPDFVPGDAVAVYRHTVDLAVPAFDFGEVSDTRSYVFTPQAVTEGYAMLQKGELTLPFPACIFIITQMPAELPGFDTFVDNLLVLEQTAPNAIVATVFDHERGARALRYKLRSGDTASWGGIEVMLQLSPQRIEVLAPEGTWASEADKKQDLKWAQEMAENVLACLATLALRGLDTADAAPTRDSIAVNRGRERGKLKPLPPVRVIDTAKIMAHPRPAHGEGHSGVTVRPHIRRGHYRTLADGRRVPVREAHIHGGPEAPEPPVYSVR